MALKQIGDEIWATLEDLRDPFNDSGFVVAGPAPEDYGGVGHMLYGMFDTVQAATEWALTNIGNEFTVNVVWKP